jgi:hypothetical protein
MKPMSQLEQDCAESLAFVLANFMVTELPALFAEDPAAIIAITLPVACALVRAEAKACRNRAHAKAYRRAVRKARALLRTEPDTAVPLAVLAGTTSFDPGSRHAELRPGIGHELLAGVQR